MRSFFVLSAALAVVAFAQLPLGSLLGSGNPVGDLGNTAGNPLGNVGSGLLGSGGPLGSIGGVAGGLVGTVEGLAGLGGLGGIGSLLGGVLTTLGGLVTSLGVVLIGLGTGLELEGLLGGLSPAALSQLTSIVGNPNATLGQIETQIQAFANTQGPDVANILATLAAQTAGVQANLTAAAAVKSPATQGLVSTVLAILNNPALDLAQVVAAVEALVDNALALVQQELTAILQELFGSTSCLLNAATSGLPVAGAAAGVGAALPLGGAQGTAQIGALLPGILGSNGLVSQLLTCISIGSLGNSTAGGVGGILPPLPVNLPL